MAAFIKIEGKREITTKIDDEFNRSCDSYITTQGFKKISYFIYFSDNNISPSTMRTIINAIKGMVNYTKVVKNIHYTTTLSKI